MLQFSNTTTKQGIIQRIEDHLGYDYGDISGNSTLLAKFTAKVNMAQNQAWSLIFQSGTRWQWDDSNHTNFPIITTNLVSGQRDYTFTEDQGNNLILDIYKVAILQSASGTVYQEIYPSDAQSDRNSPIVENNTANTGVPYHYDKTGNGIFLDPIPNYNATNGLKVYINREGYYFLTTDTTKKPGFAGILHEYIPLAVAYEEARNRSLASAKGLMIDLEKYEEKIKEYYSKRERDEIHTLRPEPIIYE